ncbi:hypothetical protein [uncultured Pseudosulfitobacter sp.]|uniref:hypothetical protein n=1 Tax=uncultured Pseudosulfitobacter sp. TaxID=2854214 RepID=UPI0030D96E74|tara:strand:+ start:588 stop:1064 length:477 start_codon:yes stop_codon:yes gene_type:complete
MRNLFLTAVFALGIPVAAIAQDIFSVIGPDGTVVKTYSLEQLDALDQTTYVTKNPFIDGTSEFSGPLARVVLADAGQDMPSDAQIRVMAINDYKIDMPLGDILDFDVMLATRRDGETMSLREKGPIWIMYPISDHAELEDEAINSRLVWQTKSMQIVE